MSSVPKAVCQNGGWIVSCIQSSPLPFASRLPDHFDEERLLGQGIKIAALRAYLMLL
jgi:hypothetical protein